MRLILNPRSVAIIGASRRKESYGYDISRRLIEGFKGDVYLVNPKADTILGRKVYASVMGIEPPIDVAVIVLPIALVPNAVRDCANKHVKGIVIVSAGFGEKAGHWADGEIRWEAAKKMEEELVEIARKAGSRILGPNCLGIYNPSINLSTGMHLPPLEGSVAFISQSGNLGNIAYSALKMKNLGFAYYLSIGNAADLGFHDIIKYLRDDQKTKIIAMYIEGLKDGREFVKEARETVKHKPIVALRVGGTEAGARAAASHTGALASKDIVVEDAFKQAGVIRALDDNELFDVTEALVNQPPLKGDRIAVITEGGGHGAIAAEIAEKSGLKLPILSDSTQEKLRKILLSIDRSIDFQPIDEHRISHPLAATANPVDIPGAGWDPMVLAECARVLLQSNEVDGILISGLFGAYHDLLARGEASSRLAELEENTAHIIGKLGKEYCKPIIVYTAWIRLKRAKEKNAYKKKRARTLEILRSYGVPVHESISTAVRCIVALRDYNIFRERTHRKEARHRRPSHSKLVEEIVEKATADGRTNLLETEVKEILKEYDILTPEFRLARSKEEAIEIGREIGYPIVMKIVSPQITHKSDAGCVKVDVKNEAEAEKAFVQIMKNAKSYREDARIYGTIMYPFAKKGMEVIVGMTENAQFGRVLMFGLGGIFVEVLSDVSFRVLPLEEADAYEMVREIKGYKILEGARGEKPKDIAAVVNIIMKISQLAMENPKVKELDLNPLIVYENGALAVDARMILGNG